MKSIKLFIGSVIAIVCLVVSGGVFTSCTNDDDLLLAGDAQTEQVSSLEDNLKAMTRGSIVTSMGTAYVSESSAMDDDYVYFSFTPNSSYIGMLTNSNINMYIRFVNGAGMTTYKLLNKNSSCFYRNQLMSASGLGVGTYYVSFVYTVGNSAYGQTSNQTDRLIVVSDDNNYDTSNDSGYADLNCTAWVAQKINEMWGINNYFYGPSNSSSLHNAVDWKDALVAKGYSTTTNYPEVGDIAWWTSNVTGCSGSGGHVAFVYYVSADYNEVKISEYNFTPPHTFNIRTLKKTGWTHNSEKFPTCFIHVQEGKR